MGAEGAGVLVCCGKRVWLQLLSLESLWTGSVGSDACMVDDGDNSLMSVIGVYLPCLDLGVVCYQEHMKELERIVIESMVAWPSYSVSKTCKECCCRRCWKDVS